MDYSQALAFIGNIQERFGSDYSLREVEELAGRAGHPERRMPVVHIAGTNGKGSAGNYISNILACAGYQVGRYVSPAVFDYRERIQRISRREADFVWRPEESYSRKEEIADRLTFLKRLCDDMVADGFCQPTAFEIETVMAFLLFEAWKVDIAVVECGLGGRLDATNIVPAPVLCVFTSISHDHMKILGNSVLEIAKEKYGIIKEGTSVVSKRQADSEKLLKEMCHAKKAELTFASDEALQKKYFLPDRTSFVYKGKEYVSGQAGVFQLENAAIAIEAVNILSGKGFGRITDEAVREGLKRSRWRGRFDLVSENPFLLADGAHNGDAAKKLCISLQEYFPGEKFSFIIGIFRDKEYEKVLGCLLPLAKDVYAVTAPGARGLPSAEICAYVHRAAQVPVYDCGVTEHAVRRALSEHPAGKTVVCGSLSILKEVYSRFSPLGTVSATGHP